MLVAEFIARMQEGQILVVDDEAGIRHSLMTLLRSEGYDVAVADDAFDALALFDEGPPALTITDPLRDRRADIPALAQHFLKQYAGANHSDATRFSDRALDVLANCDWPGNVRQLENAIEHAVVFAPADCIEAEHLPPELQVEAPTTEETQGG